MLEALQTTAEWDETPEIDFRGDVARRFRPRRAAAEGCEGVAFALEAHEALLETGHC